MDVNKSNTNIIIDIAGSSFVLGLLVFLYVMAPSKENNNFLFYEAAFFLFLGCVFLYAYFQPNKLLVCRFIIWLCRWMSYPEGKYMAIIFALAFLGFGLWSFYSWLFVENGTVGMHPN